MAKNYLASRGVTNEDIIRYKIGTSNKYEYVNSIIFPSFDKNLNLNFFLSRSYDKNKKIPYKNCKSNKKDIVFNEVIEELDKLVKFLNNYTQEELKFAALIMASKLVAKKRGLSLEQQMLVWIPLSWREE